MTFNPGIQKMVFQNIERAYNGTAPSLAVVKSAYSYDIAVVWIMAQLENLNDFCGVKEKMNTEQMECVADLVLSEYFYLKITELMLFFYRFKCGKYGEFYGVVDPQKVMIALGKFDKENYAEKVRFDKAQREKELADKRKEWARTGINRIQYRHLKKHRANINYLKSRRK